MGYTHYWYIGGCDTVQWQIAWPKIVEDARLILEAADVLVTGPVDDETGEITPPLADVNEGISLNGVADDSHEGFFIGPRDQSAFCKTLQKPYDLVVACILLRTYMLAPNHVRVYSDGDWDQEEWKKARALYKSLWGNEALWCPWEGLPRDENGNYNGEDGEAHFGLWTMYFDRHGKYHGAEEWLVTEDGEKLTPREWLERIASGRLKVNITAVKKEPPTDTLAELVRAMESIKLNFPGPTGPQDVTATVTRLDLSPAKQWLSRCEEDDTHARCKASTIEWTDFVGIHFRLIDTKRRCVIGAERDVPPFVALSYVWGGDQPKLTTSTAALLKDEGGLDKVWSSIPTTIRDAITVCEELGERYLWVDALCITQDSSKDRRIQVLRMRQIYASAKCTIAAVSSPAAREGLLPKSNGPSPPECQSEAELDDLLDKAPWSTRAWCYQEKVLSHRMIFFTTSGVYLQCQKGAFDARGAQLLPSPSGDVDKFNKVGAMLPASSAGDDDLEAYLSAVEYFSQRKITNKDDKMNAFQGVLQRYRRAMNGQPSSFTFGLPIFAFDQTFCWRTARHDPAARNDCFPSWSWLGWDAHVTFARDIFSHARTSQMIYGEDSGRGHEASLRVRQPARKSTFVSERSFGFPASPGGQFYNAPLRHMDASMADLRLAKDPVSTDGSNGLYAVYGMRCGQQAPPVREEAQAGPVTLLDFLQMPMSEIEMMDEETEAAPSVPAKKQTSEEYEAGEHAAHRDCEAHVPIGYIWLDKTWRCGRPKYCVMEFIALGGEKERNSVDGTHGNESSDTGSQGSEKWTITMLMLVQRMAKNDHLWASERVQVMDCRLTEEDWAKTGAGVKSVEMA